MKASQYNFIIFRNDKSYWYNGITHSFFTLSESLGKKVEEYLSCPEEIENASQTLFDKLRLGGFIIEDDADEIKIIKELNESEVNENHLLLTILPTLNCNFKCWYCIQDHVQGTKMSLKTRTKVKSFIAKKLEDPDLKHLSIEWFGGEPFMYFDVVEDICNFVKETAKQTDIIIKNSATTNGYFLTPDKIPFLKDNDFVRFQITLDGVKESHDKVKFQPGLDSAFARVLTNINNLLSEISNLTILLRINYTRENIDERIIGQVCDFISPENRSRVTIMPRKVWQIKADNSYQDATKKIWDGFLKEGFRVHNTDIIHDFVPCYTCRQNYLTINHNGYLLKCTANNDLYAEKPLGELSDDGKISWQPEYEKKFKLKSFDNETCLKCKYLPICMGLCPRNYIPGENYCKKNSLDLSFEDSIVNEIENGLINQ